MPINFAHCVKVWDTTSPPSSSLIAHDGSEAIQPSGKKGRGIRDGFLVGRFLESPAVPYLGTQK